MYLCSLIMEQELADAKDVKHASDLKGNFDNGGSVLSAALNVRDDRDLSSTASNTIDEDEVADVGPPDKIDIEGREGTVMPLLLQHLHLFSLLKLHLRGWKWRRRGGNVQSTGR